MTQQEAIELLEKKILEHESIDKITCTGDAGTCPNEICYVCGVRDCPGNEPLHYHYDDCPYCWQQRENREPVQLSFDFEKDINATYPLPTTV